MTQFPIINNRLELRTVLENSLKTSEELEDEEEAVDQKPKSYIVESNWEQGIHFASDSPVQASIQDTNDKSLKRLLLRSQSGVSLLLYLDLSDPRFWILHSLNKSKLTDDLIHGLVLANTSGLDFPWFSSNTLEKIGEFGKETGFSLKFKNEFLSRNDDSTEDELQKISMRFWGGKSKDIIRHLRDKKELEKGVALSGLGLKYTTDDGFIKANISNKGKFLVMRGDSIDSHFTLIGKVKETYANILRNIENNYRIKYAVTENGFKLSGSYSLIEFGESIDNLPAFAECLTACTSPFRIWGIYQEIEPGFLKIRAIDLHTYHPLNIELTPNWMRIFLPANSCGNVITRLFANLQNYFTSKLKIIGVENERLI